MIGLGPSLLTEKGRWCAEALRECRVDMWTAGPNAPLSVRVTHLPTNIVGEAQGASQCLTRLLAMGRVYDQLFPEESR